MNTNAKGYQVRAVLAAAYRGKAASLRATLYHLVKLGQAGSEERSVCGVKNLADDLALSDVVTSKGPTCPKCRPRWVKAIATEKAKDAAEHAFCDAPYERLRSVVKSLCEADNWKPLQADFFNIREGQESAAFLNAYRAQGAKAMRALKRINRDLMLHCP